MNSSRPESWRTSSSNHVIDALESLTEVCRKGLLDAAIIEGI